ncbi:MAG: hypothetical protein HGB34_02195 [Candidatus Moranbacteria bacterium]|nr:hypothetical protein [Candidatus Moranbacteria bacterium]NTW75689.1 hypothetical protein [Candidatus Moranbacteria bacterium]
MTSKTLNALKWIVGVLDGVGVPYRIGGGLATALYGSGRPVNDIDISLSGKYFPVIVPLVREHIVAGPKHYSNEKWDCETLSLSYHGQDIDLTDVDTLLMRDKDDSMWIKNKEIYGKWPDVRTEVEGVTVTLMHPRVLREYKEHLSGEHQEQDRRFLDGYIASNGL